MDTVTHALFGSAVSDGWFRKRLGPAATPFALLVSSIPDIDVVAYFISAGKAWATHRGYTHAFPVLALAGPALGYAGYRLAGKTASWAAWTALAWICLFGHTVLDLMTSWGTMPLLPFSPARISWDVAPIVDAFMTSVLLAAFVANRLLRRECVETFPNPLAYPVVHEHPRRRRIAARVGALAVLLVLAYLAIGFQQNRQAVRSARGELEASGFQPVELRALPVMFTYIAWEIVARDVEGRIRKAHYSSWAPPRPMRFTEFPAPGGELAERALATADGRMFRWYTQNMVGSEPPERVDGGWRVRLVDRRFALPGHPGAPRFAMEFAFDAHKQPVRADARAAGFGDVADELAAWWRLTRYGDAGRAD